MYTHFSHLKTTHVYPGTETVPTNPKTMFNVVIIIVPIWIYQQFFFSKHGKDTGRHTSLRAKINRRLIQFNMAWPCVVSILPRFIFDVFTFSLPLLFYAEIGERRA